MAALRLVCLYGLLLLGGVSCSTVAGRFLSQLPQTIFHPFINFYEIHLDPEDYQTLTNVPRLVATAIMGIAYGLAMLGHLPVKFGANSDGNKAAYAKDRPPGAYGAYSYRRRRSAMQHIRSRTEMDLCVMRLVCELSVEYRDDPSRFHAIEEAVLRRIFRGGEQSADRTSPELEGGTGAASPVCQQWASPCSVSWILNSLTDRPPVDSEGGAQT
ncbi:uncharacterized protein LOC119102402 [Pollicipes pollicipes]|uniref:uncharacterized protein LOC119102402 n=1 Tax=Pollicipes pollicipes TaxID=41117 RepID=UPI0018854BC2|nr:uncharacterized protein LOC119102402 [Pollicipes pollicipes]